MGVWHTFVLAAALAISAGITGANGASQNTPPPSVAEAPPAPRSEVPQTATLRAKHASGPLTPESQLILIRDVDGEYAKAVQAIPAGKKGFEIHVGKPVSQQHLSDALRLWHTAAYKGDTVQITGIEFRSHQIRIEIDGGGKGHFNWRRHIQFGIGGLQTPPPDTASEKPKGGVLILDYGRTVPNMSPQELKHDLAAFLDFSKHSAAVNWVDTLAPQYRNAIKNHMAIVGMNPDMVLAAMGRPDQKIRQTNAEGEETVDWIYGAPPARTVFVTFLGNSVIRVKQYD